MGANRLDLVHAAIRAGTLGHIEWKDEAFRLVLNDPALKRLHPNEIRRLLRQFVLDGGLLEARTETRPEFVRENPDHAWWYRANLSVPGFRDPLFLEVTIVSFDEDEPWVRIVSCHF